MDLLTLLTLIAIGWAILKNRDQKRRIRLLGHLLSQHNIEKLMEDLTNGYMRALAEQDAHRQAQIWQLLKPSETALCEQLQLLSTECNKVDPVLTRVSKLPLAVPYIDVMFPAVTFDLRKAFGIHAQGLTQAVQSGFTAEPKQKAFTVMAELFLLQHTCHWFCRSKMVASARLLARHQTQYAQVLNAVSAATQQAYRRLTQG